MRFEKKLKAAIALLESTGIRPSSYSPSIMRLLWKLGIEIPPPHFAGFAMNFAFSGLGFGLAWGLAMWITQWWWMGLSVGEAIRGSIFAGLLFGLCIAGYTRYVANKHGIPLWKDFRPMIDDPDDE